MKWGPISVSLQTLVAAFYIFTLIPGILSLQCYYCNGVTQYDPSTCFHPNPEKTLTQECRKTEKCEKKLVQIDYWQEKIERGCSSNCAGRKYIWTEDFQVHCCDNEVLCNGAPSTTGSWLKTASILLTVSLALYILNKS
jgi:hypothetical protein